MGYLSYGGGSGDGGGSVLKDTSIEYQTVSSVPTNVETTVMSFTNSGTELHLEKLVGTGDVQAEWFVYINTVLKIKARTSVSEQNLTLEMHDFDMANGDILDVKAKHQDGSVGNFQLAAHYYR